MPLSDSALHVSSPSQVKGTFTATFFAIWLKYSPSSIIALVLVAVTSALTGPSTISQISAITSLIFLPDLAIIEGFVVTPSTIPIFENFFIASISALSIKNFIIFIPFVSCDSICLDASVTYFM